MSSLFLFCTLGIVVNIVADKVSIGSAGDMFQNRNIEGMCNLFSTIHHNYQTFEIVNHMYNTNLN